MSPTEEPDAAAADLARRRREVAKRLHPDRGGDPAAFTAAMAELDAAAADQGGGRATGAASDGRAPAGVRVTMRGRLRRLQRHAARKVSRRRFIEVPPAAQPQRPVQRSEET